MSLRSPVSAQALYIAWNVSVDPELVPIVAIQPIERAKPHESSGVAQDAHHPVVGEAVFAGQVVEAKLLSSRSVG